VSTLYIDAIEAEKARLVDAISDLKIASFGLCGDLAALHGDRHGANNWRHAQVLVKALRDQQAVRG